MNRPDPNMFKHLKTEKDLATVDTRKLTEEEYDLFCLQVCLVRKDEPSIKVNLKDLSD